MRSTVVVHFGPSDDVTLYLDGPAMAADEARAWLDEQFVHEDCEPLRASGKVLIADKVLALAHTVGRSRFDGVTQVLSRSTAHMCDHCSIAMSHFNRTPRLTARKRTVDEQLVGLDDVQALGHGHLTQNARHVRH